MNVIAATQLIAREMKMTQKRELQYSPVLSSDKPIAAKAITAMAVAPKSGHWHWDTTSRITEILSSPLSMRTFIPSVMTIALSVSMQSAMIKAPREMRSSRMSLKYITWIVARIVSSRTTPIIIPARSPIAKRSTTNTMLTALTRLKAKALVAMVTASGWKLISPISIPIG